MKLSHAPITAKRIWIPAFAGMTKNAFDDTL